MGDAAESELLKLWEDKNSRVRARALWLLGKIPGRGRHYVDIASRADDKNLRCQSIRLARQLDEVDVLPVVARLVSDPSPAVRRECAIALRHNKADEAAGLWSQLAMQHDGEDRWYLEALGIGADQQWDRFLSAWLKAVGGKWNTKAGRDIVWRSRGSQSYDWISQVLNDPSVPLSELPRFFRAVDFLPADAKAGVIGKLAFKKTGNVERSRLITTESLRRLTPVSLSNNPTYKQALREALSGMDRDADFVRLVARFDVQERYPELLEIAQQDSEGQVGVEAVRTLLGKDQRTLLMAALSSPDVETVNNTISVLGSSADNRCSDLLAQLINSKTTDLEIRRNAVRAIAKNREGASRLVRVVEADRLDSSLAAAAAASLHRVQWRDVREKAQELFPLPPSKGAEELPSIGELAAERGDHLNGKKVFETTGTCAKCHIVRNEGKEVGPDLSEIGSKLSREAMFESILYPSAGISHNYEAYNLVSVDGDSVVGLLTSSSDSEVIITGEDGIARTFARKGRRVARKATDFVNAQRHTEADDKTRAGRCR